MTKFAQASFKNKANKAVLTGEYVEQSANAWFLAVEGKVQVLLFSEWESIANPKSDDAFNDIFGTFFGGR